MSVKPVFRVGRSDIERNRLLIEGTASHLMGSLVAIDASNDESLEHGLRHITLSLGT